LIGLNVCGGKNDFVDCDLLLDNLLDLVLPNGVVALGDFLEASSDLFNYMNDVLDI